MSKVDSTLNLQLYAYLPVSELKYSSSSTIAADFSSLPISILLGRKASVHNLSLSMKSTEKGDECFEFFVLFYKLGDSRFILTFGVRS